MDVFFFSSRRRHTRYWRDWSSDVCSSDLVYAAGGKDLDVLEPVAIQLPANLPHQVPKVAAAVARGVEPDGVDRVRDGAGGDQGAELLVVEGVDEDRAPDIWRDHLVEGLRDRKSTR